MTGSLLKRMCAGLIDGTRTATSRTPSGCVSVSCEVYTLRVVEETLHGGPRAFAMVCTYSAILTRKVRCRGPGSNWRSLGYELDKILARLCVSSTYGLVDLPIHELEHIRPCSKVTTADKE